MASNANCTVKVAVTWDGRLLGGRAVLHVFDEHWLQAHTCYELMQHVAKDIDPELSFDLVEQVTMVCVEHEDIVTGSGRKRRRPSASVTANRLLHVNVHDVMEDVPTRHFQFEVTLQAVRRARAHVVNVFDRMKAAQSTKNMHYPPPRNFDSMDAKDKLHNLLLDWLREQKAGWTRAEADNEGKTFVKHVTAALFPLSSDMFDSMSDPKNAGTYRFACCLLAAHMPTYMQRTEAYVLYASSSSRRLSVSLLSAPGRAR